MAPKPLTATEKMEKARANTRRSAARELLYGVILSRLWPSYLMPAKTRQAVNGELQHVVSVDTPAGRLIYRISAEERPLFAHLEERANDGKPAEGKEGILAALAEHGWEYCSCSCHKEGYRCLECCDGVVGFLET